MAQRLSKWLFDVPYPYRGVYAKRRAKGLRLLGWLIIGLMILTTVLRIAEYRAGVSLPLTGPQSVLNYSARLVVVLGILMVMNLVIMVLLNRGQFGAGLAIYLVMLFLVALLSAVFRSTTVEFWLMFFSLPLVAAGVFGDQRSFIIVAVLSFLCAVGLSPLTQSGILITSNLTSPTALETMLITGMVFIINAMTLAIGLSTQQTLVRDYAQVSTSIDALATFTKVTLATGARDDVFSDTVESIREQAGYHFAQIFVLEGQTNLLLLRAMTGVNSVQIAANRQRITPSDDHVFNAVIRQAATRRVAYSDPIELRRSWLPTTKAELIVPIMRGTHVFGILNVQSVDPDAFHPENIQQLEMVAMQLAFTIREAELNDFLHEATDQQTQLRAQLQRVSVESAAQSGLRGAVEGELQGRLDRALGFDWHNGMIVGNTAVSQAQQRAMTNAMPETFESGGEHGLTVPILLRGQVLGALEFRANRNAGWNSRQIELARVIAQRLALALDNLRLFEQAQITANRERVASQLSARLQTRTDVDSLLGMATETFQEALGATRTSIRFGSLDLTTTIPALSSTGTNGHEPQGSKETP